MENTLRWAFVTAIAPVAWGTNYFVTHEYLPRLSAVRRCVPRTARRRTPALPGPAPSPRSLVVAVPAARRLQYGRVLRAHLPRVAAAAGRASASTIMSASPLTMALFAWGLLSERPTMQVLTGAAAGIAGVCLLLGAGSQPVDLRGVAGSGSRFDDVVLRIRPGEEVGPGRRAARDNVLATDRGRPGAGPVRGDLRGNAAKPGRTGARRFRVRRTRRRPRVHSVVHRPASPERRDRRADRTPQPGHRRTPRRPGVGRGAHRPTGGRTGAGATRDRGQPAKVYRCTSSGARPS